MPTRVLTRSRKRQTSSTRYSMDASHRLVVTKSSINRDQTRIRQRLTGTVSIDSQNRAIFNPDPRPGRSPAESEVISLDGRWLLRRDHTLLFTLHGTPGAARQTLRLQGRFTHADAHNLTLVYERLDRSGNRVSQEITLSGHWQADRMNRLAFLVSRADGVQDRLTFQGAWELGEKHALTYRHRIASGAKKGVFSEQLLRFQGFWDVPAVGRLVYRVDGSPNSAFEFRAAVQTPSLRASEGRLAWQVGIGLSRQRMTAARVVLFGAWKLRDDRSLSFEVPYGDGRVQGIRFEGTYAWGGRNAVTVELADGSRRPFGVSLTLTRELSSSASVFLNVRAGGAEKSAIAGVRVQF